ncbi:unnamed protein product [Ceratitis capitata]|uniref:(Mediterranean fruit fly) hypothetical protein n=1 Tax=Ceratitis capitata TaxID=7213 RepID=A0A811UHH6_CERCA|nr:unnamed protein product [Ceratitis capitata]
MSMTTTIQAMAALDKWLEQTHDPKRAKELTKRIELSWQLRADGTLERMTGWINLPTSLLTGLVTTRHKARQTCEVTPGEHGEGLVASYKRLCWKSRDDEEDGTLLPRYTSPPDETINISIRQGAVSQTAMPGQAALSSQKRGKTAATTPVIPITPTALTVEHWSMHEREKILQIIISKYGKNENSGCNGNYASNQLVGELQFWSALKTPATFDERQFLHCLPVASEIANIMSPTLPTAKRK